MNRSSGFTRGGDSSKVRLSSKDSKSAEKKSSVLKPVKASGGNSSDEGEPENEQIGRQFSELVDALAERRTSDRLKAFDVLSENLAQNFLSNLIGGHEETIQLFISNAIKKGEAEEIRAACRLIGVFSLTVEGDGFSPLAALEGPLMEIIKNSAKSPVARQAAAEALAFAAFFGASSEEICREVMRKFHEVLATSYSQAGLEDFLVALCDGWGLLATLVEEKTIVNDEMNKEIPLLVSLLRHEAVAVRIAAGENIALMFSDLHKAQREEEEEAAEDDEEEEPVVSFLSSDHCTLDSALMGILTELLKNLSTDSSRHRARKDRAHQRSTFREILRAVEEGEEISESVIINKKKLEFHGFSQLKQLNALREICGPGLPAHFANNPAVAEMFEFGELAEAEKTKAESEKEKADAKAASKGRKKAAYLEHDKQRKKKNAAGQEEE